MKKNLTLPKNSHAEIFCSIRIKDNTKKNAAILQEAANKKKFGRKIKLNDVIDFALSLLQPEHIKKLQTQSFTNEDRKEQMRLIYIDKIGTITKEEFTGFMMTDEFTEFRKQHFAEISSAAF
ncbi:MAG: hypothetical protein JNM24_19980 [Bdellovibrionaceae bacterium]|nr:hypothetical protein [Pseudobdellovibrionaceae bacterium]